MIKDFFSDRGLDGPDGRPLHSYECRKAEYDQLSELLPSRIPAGKIIDSTAQWFVLWASERIRREYDGTLSRWKFVFDGLGLDFVRPTMEWLTESGLKCWHRDLRIRESDRKRMFFYTLLAEGGLPDALLSRESGYSAAVLGTVTELAKAHVCDLDTALIVSRRRLSSLPAAFQNNDSIQLLVDLSLAFVELRKRLPDEVNQIAAEQWLDRNFPDWAQDLPLRLSEDARRLILRPALSLDIDKGAKTGPLCQRMLRKRTGGEGWNGAVRIFDSSLVTSAMAPALSPYKGMVLRLVTDNLPSYRASPVENGWQLAATGRKDHWTPLDPSEALIFSVHKDGMSLDDITVDSGLPPCDEAPSFWRSEVSANRNPDTLVLMHGTRTRGEYLWALLPESMKPESDDGIKIGMPEAGPGGNLWPLSGVGQILLGEETVSIATGSDEEDEMAQFVIIGETFRDWRSKSGLAVYRGDPHCLGGLGEGHLANVSRSVRDRPVAGILGAKIVEWVSGDAVRSRAKFVVLPESLQLSAREIEHGAVALRGSGLPLEWKITLETGGAIQTAEPTEDGSVELHLNAEGNDTADLGLQLYDPTSGKTLQLERPWPVNDPVLTDPEGRRLRSNRELALESLTGWRGQLPDRGGAMSLRIAGMGEAVAFHAQGTQRLAVFHSLLSQALSLAGPDGRINLRLVNIGETPRLAIGRYDWDCETASNIVAAKGEASFQAVSINSPIEKREMHVTGQLHLDEWLGGSPATWFVQARSTAGIMRSFTWSGNTKSELDSGAMIEESVNLFDEMLSDVGHAGWKETTDLIRESRSAGDCSALGRVQAMVRRPEVAIALLFSAKASELPDMLELETETPIWWPLVKADKWQNAIDLGIRKLARQLTEKSFNEDEALGLAKDQISRMATGIVEIRKDLRAHVAHALKNNGVQPIVNHEYGSVDELLVSQPLGTFIDKARELAARPPEVPNGTGGLELVRMQAPSQFSAGLHPFLIGPLVVAEVAAGFAERPQPDKILKLMALRHAAPDWFDDAVSLGLNEAIRILESSR